VAKISSGLRGKLLDNQKRQVRLTLKSKQGMGALFILPGLRMILTLKTCMIIPWALRLLKFLAHAAPLRQPLILLTRL
jgi:hypothetical protein